MLYISTVIIPADNEKDLEEKLMINKRAELVLNHYLKYSSKRHMQSINIMLTIIFEKRSENS